MNYTVNIIGMGVTPRDLTQTHQEIIAQADILIGGERHLAFFNHLGAEKKAITKDLKALAAFICEQMATRRIVVLASGDPLFFGVGGYLIQTLGPDHVSVHPNISTVAVAYARAKMAWSHAGVVSLHGRDHRADLFRTLQTHDHAAVFTDPRHNPAWLAALLLSKGFHHFQMGVFEQLGTPLEKIGWYDLSQAQSMTFNEPNLVILKSITGRERPALHLGMPDDAFAHEKGLLTKQEIRATVLARLSLSPEHTLWDLGAGSGSVAIEASLLITRGAIVAVEQNASRVSQIESNMRRWGVVNMEVVQAVLPNGLENLPAPDRVFIGGGGRDLARIITAAAALMSPGGVMVVNTVLLANLERILNTLRNLGFETEAVQIQICKTKAMPWSERFEAGNPVWILSGRKSE